MAKRTITTVPGRKVRESVAVQGARLIRTTRLQPAGTAMGGLPPKRDPADVTRQELNTENNRRNEEGKGNAKD